MQSNYDFDETISLLEHDAEIDQIVEDILQFVYVDFPKSYPGESIAYVSLDNITNSEKIQKIINRLICSSSKLNINLVIDKKECKWPYLSLEYKT